MKTNYLTFVLLLCTTFVLAQNNDFNNQGGDLLWSNPSNWSQGVVPNISNTGQVRMPLTVESLVDTNISIKKIQTTFATPGDVPIAGNGTLTIDAGANNNNAIENVSNNNVALNFKGNLEINNSAGGFTLMRSLNGSSNAINFDSGSTLTLTTNLGVISTASPLFNFNGSIQGDGNLRFGPNTLNTFGSTSSNPNWTGEVVFLANAQTVVNTTDNNIFYDGFKIQVNGNGSSIQINGENVYSGNIVIGGGHTFTFEANKNLDGLGEIEFSNNGTLNLDIDSAVTNLTFTDNSAVEWNNGSLNITGYQEGVIRFGTDETGLTDQQLSQITADNGGQVLELDANGFLVNETMSVDEFQNRKTPIITSTLVDNRLKFSQPQNYVKIIDINGRVLINNENNNQLEINVNTLSPGNYFAVFGNNKVERFLKK